MDKRKRLYSVFVVICCLIVFTITYAITYIQMGMVGSDYYVHANRAVTYVIDYEGIKKLMLSSGVLWEFFVKALSQVISARVAASTVSGLFNVFLFYLVYHIFELTQYSEIWALFTILVGPLYFPWFNKNYYLGQGTPNTWHNPTNLSVKPIAIIIFMVIISLIEVIESKDLQNGEQNGVVTSGKYYILLVLLLVLSAYAKPSFLQGMIPALGLYFVVSCIRNRFEYFKGYFLLAACFIPAVILMFAQVFTYFYTEERAEISGGIGISWLKVWHLMTPNVLVSFVLAFAFPIFYIAGNYKELLKKKDIQISICMVIVTWLEASVLYEINRPEHGNFTWGYLIAMSIMWIYTLKYASVDFEKLIYRIKEGKKAVSAKEVVNCLLFAGHIIFGITYVVMLITKEGYWL